MEPFDYYVYGAKINRQVPRFEAPLIGPDSLNIFSVNQAILKGPFILIFARSTEAVTFSLDIPFYIVLRDPPSAIHTKKDPVIADPTLEIAESFGVLDEKTGLFIPSIFGIKASGELAFKVEGIALNTIDASVLRSLMRSLKS